MPRTSVGTCPQPESDTALFAHIAYRLEGTATSEIRRYATEVLQINVGDNAIRKAPATAMRISASAAPELAVRPWIRVDTRALDFFTAVVRLRVLEDTPFGGVDDVSGVLEVFRLQRGDELVAIVMYERRSDQERLQSELGEVADILSWDVIDRHTQEPTLATWRHLTTEAARREGLAL